MDVNDLQQRGERDRELVEAVARGDRAAFAELFDGHAEQAQRMLLRLGVAGASIGPALHELFLEFWRAAPRMDPTVPVGAQLLAFALVQLRGDAPAGAPTEAAA